MPNRTGVKVTWRKRLEARLRRGNPWAAISLGIIWLVLGVGLLTINVVVSHRQDWVTMTLWLVTGALSLGVGLWGRRTKQRTSRPVQ